MRTVLFIILAFFGGFIAHAYFYGTTTISLGAIAAPVAPVVQNMNIIVGDKPEYLITYEDGKFTPALSTVRYGRYIKILNTSKSLMWIQSDYKELNTVRGYAEQEQVRIRADRTGSFTITNKLNINATATINVVK